MMTGMRSPAERIFRKAFWGGLCGLLVAYILILVVAILYRHPKRFDFTQEKEYTLSGDTLNKLGLLGERPPGEDVKVIFPYFFQAENPVDEIRAQILWRARTLLTEYMALQKRLVWEAQLDLAVRSDAEVWEKLCDRFDLSRNQFNQFIFLTSDGKLKQPVTADDLAVYDRPADRLDRAQVHEFRGEQALNAAITRFAYRERKKIYALEDHQEAGLQDDGPRGMSIFREKLESYGFEVLSLSFRREPKVPETCDLLLIAAPEAPMEPEDRRRVDDYLKSGGRLLVALGKDGTGLEDLLDRWNIRVQSGRVYQRYVRGPVSGWIPTLEVDDFNLKHPITSPFQKGSFGILCADARAVELRDADGLHGEFLIRTSDDAFVDRNRSNQREGDEAVGQVVLGGAVWRPMPGRPPPDYRHVDTRIVVLGDATALLNPRFPQYSHRDLLFNSVNWLLGKEERLAVGPTAWTRRVLPWSPQIQSVLFWVPIFLFPGIVVSFGSFIYFLRRT